jgi:uncharacterized protein YyaL (SSP411 family)
LLQHKDNPVDWHPWGDAAFDLARREQKPIFLSIGYSTCHWCHVMEHESFEKDAVAEVLNRYFVSIKVDREERPDVDRVYMTFVQATTGSGGWPMSVWLTPSLQPFYGGTYFPPASKWGKPGFVDVLEEIARVWREERDKVEQSAASIVSRLRSVGSSAAAGATAPSVPDASVLTGATMEFAAAFDGRRGGFGSAPKFPRPSELLFLLREHSRTGKDEPRDMAVITLRAMALGGMRDHVGGGFHRYSVDADWRVPHFEKMLYDQAQLVLAFLEAAQATGDAFFAEVARDSLAYVRRDLTDPGGGFYSAEDADSLPPERAGDPHAHKMEGAFYIWHEREVRELLGADADVFCARYGILPDGNAPFDPQGEFTHKNLLHTARALDDVASRTGRSIEEVEAALSSGRRALQARRAARPRPGLDDKVLTAWNGLMIAAFARAGRTLDGGAEYVADAQRAASFVRAHMWDGRRLLRRYRQGDAGIEAYAEDFAYLVFGLIELFQADGNPDWLEWALLLQREQDRLFWDSNAGGWFSTTGNDPSVLLRLKEEYDGAEPAASSVSVLNLLALAHLVDDASMIGKVERTLSTSAERAGQGGRSAPMMMSALSIYHAGLTQVVVTGAPQSPSASGLYDVLRRRYAPATLLVPALPSHRDALAMLMPWAGRMSSDESRATAYVCRAFTCQAPAGTPEALTQALAGASAPL